MPSLTCGAVMVLENQITRCALVFLFTYFISTDILVHPCVTSIDSSMLISSSVAVTDDSAFNGPYKFPFIPPFDLFQLCYYTSQVPVPPILGFYQLTEDGPQAQISIKLKLHESVKNGFDYCEAEIPFFNRGQIKHFDHRISHGQLESSKEKSLLVWVIGQKFPKSLEITLTGTVTFSSEKHPNDPVDPICVGNTAYVKIVSIAFIQNSRLQSDGMLHRPAFDPSLLNGKAKDCDLARTDLGRLLYLELQGSSTCHVQIVL
ncbi:unnamed protein product [Ranitomeya imitator]|uniref:AP-5 complex subunit mu-1 n=1 Tax=Ranitomeya imitator TaxID=111125 RepID=A0ABN9L9B1_9NEOB|nr:unnamed protein product [Ranitomeya imitator]